MRLDWMLPRPGTIQHHLQLIAIFHQLLHSTNFNVLVLNCDNKTLDTLSTITDSLLTTPNRHEVIILNFDRDHNQSIYEWRPFFARALSVEIYDDHDDPNLIGRWNSIMLNIFPKFIRIYQPHASIENFYNYYRHTTIIKMETIGLEVISYNYNDSFKPRMQTDASGELFDEFFMDRTIDLGGKNVYMECESNVPNQFNARAFVDGKEKTGLGGIYAYIGQVIGKYLNARFVFVVPYGIMLNNDSDSPYQWYEELKQRQYQTDFVLPYADKESLTVDLFDEYTFLGIPLHPHKQENFVVLVPNVRRPSTRIWQMFAKSPIVSIWCSAIILFSLVRCILRRLARNDSMERVPADRITFETWALSFGWTISSNAKLRRPERVLLVFISLFAMISGIICSGMLLHEFTFNVFVSSVNTLHELHKQKTMTIVMPWALELNEDIWNENHTLVYTQLDNIYGEILNGNTVSSYVVPESVADVLLAEEHMFDPYGQPIFHKIKERIYAKYMSIHTANHILHPSMHVLMQRLVTHGLVHHFEVKTKLALGVRTNRRTDQSVFGDGASSVSMGQVFFVFVVFAMGQALSVLALLVELIYYRCKCS